MYGSIEMETPFFKMLHVYSRVIILILVSLPFEIKSTQQINVMISPVEPFAFFEDDTPELKGLEVKIIENFGKKFKFQIKFVVWNESLNEVFSSKNRTHNFLKLTQNL